MTLPFRFRCLAVLVVTPAAASAQLPEIMLDPRVELTSLVARLAGYEEYNVCAFPRFQAAADAWFAPYRDHRVIRLARAAQMRDSAGIGFDAVPSLAIHLGPLPGLVPSRPLRDTTGFLDRRWRTVDLDAFLAALRDFARESRFEAFLATQRPLADSVVARLRDRVVGDIDFTWFERFYGVRPAGKFQLTPNLCNGAGNFGPKASDAAGIERLYAIVSVGNVDSGGVPTFRDGLAPTVIHEFNHSYINPLFGRHFERFRRPAEAVFARSEQEMQALAYGNALTTLNESMVRAGVVRYQLARHGADAAAEETIRQVGLGFVWMEELVERLAEYERSRATYPTLEAFVPRLVAYWDSLAPRVPALQAALEARRPQLAAMTPADGAAAVDPATTQLVLRFDRPMRSAVSINLGPGGNATWPKTSAPVWNADRTAVTLTIALQPGTSYEMRLTGNGFRSVEGVPLRQRLVRFATRAAP